MTKCRQDFGAGLCLCLFATLALFGCGGDQEHQPAPQNAAYAIRPEATLTTGVLRRDAQGLPLEWMLPSGQRTTPFAVPGARRLEIEGYTMPLGLAVHPQGRHLFLTTSGRGAQGLFVVDVESGAVLERRDGGFFLGLSFRPPHGNELYVAGAGRNVVESYAFDPGPGTLTPLPGRSMPVPGFAGGICVSPDGSLLLALSQMTGFLRAFALDTAREVGSVQTGANPYAVAIHPGGREAYVSCEQTSTLEVFDISDPAAMRRTASLPTQKNPEALLLNQDGTRLFVTNADEDSVSVFEIGPGGPGLPATLDLRRTPGLEYGSSPNAVAFSPARERLYVAQARLNKLAVIDATTGAHLGDIPTGAYPTALALQTVEAGDGGARETLFVANGKGIGTPWEGGMGQVPGDLGILPVPPDSLLGTLTDQAAANNAFPAGLFDVSAGPWNHPVPRSRDRLDPTPIKHVFLVIRENKTYDCLLGPYRPAVGQANGDPAKALDEYEKLLPNLYKLAGRFTVCDNYYSNAEASNQGHEMLTSTTANTYVEKLVFAEGRPIPFELEMVLNPVTWPKKDFIFQNALRSGISFRNYGEAVGAGRDLLLLNEEYCYRSAIDPPWFHMFSKDEDKLRGRIREWESARFSGPKFPRLVVMLLPNDHTFGSTPLMPTHNAMIADNDLATGRFVEWLSRSPYWMESVAFITEDDPQEGLDHVDPHRTLMLAVSPWVKPGYVSHVRYNEAHLYATIEHLLGMPPLTIFDEAAQPMYDLFDFTASPEAFDHEPKQWPWESNPLGTYGARREAGMYFAQPDMAEGLLEVEAAMENERRQARRLPRRIEEGALRWWRDIDRRGATRAGSAPRDPDPVPALEALVQAARQEDREGFRRLLDHGSAEWCRLYGERRDYLATTILPEDPVQELLGQFQRLRPRPLTSRVEGDTAVVEVAYADGLSAQLHFLLEEGKWKLHLSKELAATLRIIGDSCLVKQTFETSRSLLPADRR